MNYPTLFAHGVLSSVIEPLTNDQPAETAVVTGPSGTGKTCISQFVTERLREEALEVEATYVNCWRNYTQFRTLYQILEDIGTSIDIHRQSTPHDELIDRLHHDGLGGMLQGIGELTSIVLRPEPLDVKIEQRYKRA